jgi:hypothetical protein
VAVFAAVVSVAGCIDVGHPAEIGCLVDMTEPGCMPGADASGTNDASAIDAGSDSAMHLDAPRSDDAESDSAGPSEPDADAGALPFSDGPIDSAGDESLTDAASDGSSVD